ncbi:hypothetical protein [Actinoplanes rectilineatus]|nr:hypothetical protein [Actinoplanes rectilineatus]
MRNEIGQSVDHFKRAATIAAKETSSTVGPKINAARDRVQPAAGKARDAASNSWDSALAALTPLVAAATDNVREAGKTSKKAVKRQAKVERKNAQKLQKRASKAMGRSSKSGRGSRLAGFALLGTAVGVGAAYYAKKRREAQWDEYDPAPRSGADDAAFEPIEPSVYTTSNGTVTDKSEQNPR